MERIRLQIINKSEIVTYEELIKYMKILSDFRDHYDIWSKNDGPIFYRYSENFGPKKLKQFDIIGKNGFHVIPHGYTSEICCYNRWSDYNGLGKIKHENQRNIDNNDIIEDIVIYSDELSHCGQNKKCVPNQFLDFTTDILASAFSKTSIGRSIRLLRIGNYLFTIEMWSRDDWRSNCGDCEERITSCEKFINYRKDINIDLPLWAIDFVHKDILLNAIDFNISPGTKVKGMEKFLHAEDIHDEINNWLKNDNNYKRYEKFVEEINDGRFL